MAVKDKIMNWINSWKQGSKQDDKIKLNVRFGLFTILDFDWDISSKKFRFILLNCGFQCGKW